MSSNAILFDSVTKSYEIQTGSSYGSLRDDLAHTLLFRKATPLRLIEAVKNITFRIDRGESVALVGSNGAGKSTILKLISGISPPTTGTVETHGTIVPLMELGAGFHFELTGRENISFFGAILGMKKEEVIRNVPSIIEYSELGDFIDVPLKKYSSGMQLRLGFATAIHTKPDILIVDEILSVGDEAFAKKCLNSIHALREAGTTLVIVSHFPSIISTFAERALYIQKGQLVESGPPQKILDRYHQDQNLA